MLLRYRSGFGLRPREFLIMGAGVGLLVVGVFAI
jgi:hypothetical protein